MPIWFSSAKSRLALAALILRCEPEERFREVFWALVIAAATFLVPLNLKLSKERKKYSGIVSAKGAAPEEIRPLHPSAGAQ
jgi:hypothetical protein